MEQRNDLILREIEKLSLFLKKLINSLTGANSNDIEAGIKQISEALKTELDLSIREIIEIENKDLITKLNDIHETNIENLAELISKIVEKLSKVENDYGFDQKELANKAIILIDYLDKNSNTFSITRMNIKNVLQQWV